MRTLTRLKKQGTTSKPSSGTQWKSQSCGKHKYTKVHNCPPPINNLIDPSCSWSSGDPYALPYQTPLTPPRVVLREWAQHNTSAPSCGSPVTTIALLCTCSHFGKNPQEIDLPDLILTSVILSFLTISISFLPYSVRPLPTLLFKRRTFSHPPIIS